MCVHALLVNSNIWTTCATSHPISLRRGTGWGPLCCSWLPKCCCQYGGCQGAVVSWRCSVLGWLCPSLFPCIYLDLVLSLWLTLPWAISHFVGLQSVPAPGTRGPCTSHGLCRQLQIPLLEDVFCLVTCWDSAVWQSFSKHSPSPLSIDNKGRVLNPTLVL